MVGIHAGLPGLDPQHLYCLLYLVSGEWQAAHPIVNVEIRRLLGGKAPEEAAAAHDEHRHL
jgi:hypothetical protein